MFITAQSLANSYAEKRLGPRLYYDNEEPWRGRVIRIYMYDFQVTGFNIATVALVISLAATVVFNSFLFLLGTYLIADIRKSFFTGLQDIAVIRLGRQVSRDSWGPVKHRFMESRLWMNKLPALPDLSMPLLDRAFIPQQQ